jgi:hypothetical protein
MKHLAVIQAGISAGETQNAIRAQLKSDAGFEMSAAQFSRHLRAFALKSTAQEVLPLKPNPVDAKAGPRQTTSTPTTSTTRPLTKADLRQIGESMDDMDLEALVAGKGDVSRK